MRIHARFGEIWKDLGSSWKVWGRLGRFGVLGVDYGMVNDDYSISVQGFFLFVIVTSCLFL